MAEQLEAEFAEGDTDSTGNTGPIKRRGRVENLIPWKPGQSGNPNGRPRRKPITDAYLQLLESIDPRDKKLKRTFAQRIAQAMVDQVVKNGSVAAAAEIADRIEGKVAQRQEHTGADGGPMVFESLGSRQEVEVKIAMLLSQAQERRQDAVKQESVIQKDEFVIQPAGPKSLGEIALEPVAKSSNVEAIGYDPVGLTLLVRYKSQDCYVWRGIPQDEYQALRSAESAGRYLKSIEKRYGLGTKVSPAELTPGVVIDGIDMDW